jgi:transcriptional regulator with XRE-family HTH domain
MFKSHAELIASLPIATAGEVVADHIARNIVAVGAEHWRARLVAEIEADPRGKAGLAERMGISRSYISRVLSTGSSRLPEQQTITFARRFLSHIGALNCPATGEQIDRKVCAAAHEYAPTHNPLSMQRWRQCQSCANRPRRTKEVKQHDQTD